MIKKKSRYEAWWHVGLYNLNTQRQADLSLRTPLVRLVRLSLSSNKNQQVDLVYTHLG